VQFLPLDGSDARARWSDAIDGGTAPGGSLWVPEALDPDAFRSEVQGEFPEWAGAHARSWLDASVDGAEVEDALDLPIATRRLSDRIDLLDLTRGPTGAFKDVGSRFLARLWSAAPPHPAGLRTVLVATSGDTGGAVAAAVDGIAGLRAVVLYPKGRVSEVQRRQFTTRGGNVRAVEVEGTFDRCQTMVRGAFSDRERAAALGLVSANSINPGRLLPQSLYHAWAAGRDPGRPFVVPSGNLGNVTACLLARVMGAPIASVHAVVNENDHLVRSVSGQGPAASTAVRTDSTAMDVARPSNLARLEWLAGCQEAGLSALVDPVSIEVESARAAQRRALDEFGIVIDPHTAVGLARAFQMIEVDPAVRPLVVETAHPAKFPEVVQAVLGVDPPEAPHLDRPGSEHIDQVTGTPDALLQYIDGWWAA